MALFVAYNPTNMRDTTVWYGQVIYADGYEIQISDGYQTSTLYGNFYYDPNGYVDENSVITAMYINTYNADAYAEGFSLTLNEYDAYVSDGNNSDLVFRITQGDDYFYGSWGNDTVEGGAGTDTVVLDDSSDDISVIAISGGYSISSFEGTDLIYNVELIQLSDGVFSISDLVIDLPSSTASPGYKNFAITGDNLVDAMTHGYMWDLTSERLIDFAVANGFAGEYWNSPSDVLAHMESALDLISYYTDVGFNNLGFYGNASTAYEYGSEITLSVDAQYISSIYGNNVWAIGNFPSGLEDQYWYDGFGGDLYLNVNSEANYLPSYEPGSTGWALLLHELGHVLGLKHPHDDGGTGRPTFAELDLQGLDIDYATVMSYNDDINWNQISYDPATPMILDVLALQYLYGKNMTSNAGDSIFNLQDSEGFYVTYWDASGNDHIDASTTASGWQIELPISTDSTLIDTNVGVALSLDVNGAVDLTSVIWLAGNYEEATGSAFSDVIIGNDQANRLDGGAGADEIVDGFGNDTVFGGDGDDLILNIGGKDQFDGGMGIDTLITDLSVDYEARSLFARIDAERGIEGRLWSSTDQDSISNIENYILVGDFNSVVIGNSDSNQIETDSGDDRIAGGNGADTITSGSGSDLIVWRSVSEFGDTLTDFSATDMLDISQAIEPYLAQGYLKSEILQITQANSDTTVEVNIDGSFATVATLSNFLSSDLSLDQVVTDYDPWSGLAYHWASHYQLPNTVVDTRLLNQERELTDNETGRAISAADALAALKLAVGINPNTNGYEVSPYQLISADVNQDGRVSAADALSILKMAVGLSSAPEREWIFVNEEIDFYDDVSGAYTTNRSTIDWNQIHDSAVAVDSQTNLVALLKGDVNASWQSDGANVQIDPSYFTALESSGVGPAEQWWV